MKIAIIIPYFGKWPVWKNLFFDSCKGNADIDFFFYTDCGIPNDVSNNMHFFEMSFDAYCVFVSKKLGIDFHPFSAYKLCDLKPFYGYIHSDELVGYDFWGFADVDLVFGDIRKFYTNMVLEKYDVLSTHFDRVSGHLALFRNIPKYTNTCFEIKKWKELLCDNRNHLLDEYAFSCLIFPYSHIPRWFYGKMLKIFGWNIADYIHRSFFMYLKTFVNMDVRKLRFEDMNIHPIWSGSSNWKYLSCKISKDHNSHVYDVDKVEECIYCHFLPYKKNNNWTQMNDIVISTQYLINMNGIECISSIGD